MPKQALVDLDILHRLLESGGQGPAG